MCVSCAVLNEVRSGCSRGGTVLSRALSVRLSAGGEARKLDCRFCVNTSGGEEVVDVPQLTADGEPDPSHTSPSCVGRVSTRSTERQSRQSRTP
jgi:hypothetical protein